MAAPIIQAVYPDAELVTLAIVDLLSAENDGPVADLDIVTFLDDGWQPPLVQVNRIGGAPDTSDITDYPIMRLAMYGVDRMAAWNLAGQVEGLMIGMRHRAVYVPEYDRSVLLDSVDIAVGGQQLPDVDPDDRRVIKDFVIGFRRPRLTAG